GRPGSAPRAGTARGSPAKAAAPGGAPAAGTAILVDLAGVELAPLLGIAEQVIGGRRLLEPRLHLLVAGVDVGMQLLRELAISLLDLVRRCARGNAECFVRVSHKIQSPPGNKGKGCPISVQVAGW